MQLISNFAVVLQLYVQHSVCGPCGGNIFVSCLQAVVVRQGKTGPFLNIGIFDIEIVNRKYRYWMPKQVSVASPQ
jgi:hypothetical protein